MRALLCRSLGSLDNLEVGELEAPKLGTGQVRIAAKASGINFPDILMVEGKYQVKPEMPFVPGLELAGEVLECAPGVDHVRPGDRVLAFARFGGAHADEVVLPAGIVTPIPDDMDFVTAAAFPVAYGTAHFALAYRGNLKAGETLLVLGAAGGVGLAAIEVGKYLGARVIAAASSAEKLAVAKQHGADELINYTDGNLRDEVRELTGGKGVDVVFDPVGGDAFTQSVRCIGWEGRILVIGFASGDIPHVAANMILVKNFSVTGVVFGEHSHRYPDESRQRWTGLLADYGSGHFKPKVMKTYGLEDARSAISDLAERRALGKIVLTR
ncbi:MAG: NADPH2:quinone reductase [Hyphomicrobiaceae bacterium]|jgi:NADPH:quinone reductase